MRHIHAALFKGVARRIASSGVNPSLHAFQQAIAETALELAWEAVQMRSYENRQQLAKAILTPEGLVKVLRINSRLYEVDRLALQRIANLLATPALLALAEPCANPAAKPQLVSAR